MDSRIAKGRAVRAGQVAARVVPVDPSKAPVDPSRALAGPVDQMAGQEVKEALVGRVDPHRVQAAGVDQVDPSRALAGPVDQVDRVDRVMDEADPAGIRVAIAARTGDRPHRIRPGGASTRAGTTISRSTTTTTG